MTLKIGVYLTDNVARRFKVALKRSGATKSALVNEALARLFDPPPTKDPGQEVLQALKALRKRVRHLQRDTWVAGEMLAQFIRYFLMITPPLSESERTAAKALGRERYKVFVRQIARRIGSDKGLIADVMRLIVENHPDVVARAVAEAAARETPAPEEPFGVGEARQRCEVGGGVPHA